MFGLAAAERPRAFEQSSEQSSERGHGVTIHRDRPMTGGGLVAADCRDSAEEIQILPLEILDLNPATRGRNSEHRRAMRHHPFRTARGGLKELALQIGREDFGDSRSSRYTFTAS
jgi:hypothetical protein